MTTIAPSRKQTLRLLCAVALAAFGLAATLVVVAVPAFAQTAATRITVDGNSTDWVGRPPLLVDRTGDSERGALDFTKGYAFLNDNALYFLIEVTDPSASFKQFDIHIVADSRELSIVIHPGSANGNVLDASADFESLGPTMYSSFAFGPCLEGRVDLRDIGSPERVWITSANAMIGTCCSYPQWRPADQWEPGLVPRVQEADSGGEQGLQYALGSVPVIEQQFDIAEVRGEEPNSMVLSPDGRLAYVVCVETDNIFVIDVGTNQVVQAASLWPAAEWELGPGATTIAITPDGRDLVIGATNDESLLIVDAASLVVTRRVALLGQPCDVAVSSDGTVAYVAMSSPGTFMTFVDLASGSVTNQMPATAGVEEAHALALSPNGRQVCVAAARALAILDASTGRLVGSISYPAGWIMDVAVSPDGGRAYVSDAANGRVHVIDITRRRIASTFAVPLAEGLAVSADGSRLYVTTFGFQGNASHNLVMLDADSGDLLRSGDYIHPALYSRVISDINTPTLSSDGRTLYLPSVDADGVLVVEAQTLEARGLILVNALAEFLPWRSILSPNQPFLYVASRLRVPTTVAIVDSRTHELVGEIVADATSGHQRSFGLDITPDGNTLLVLSSADHCLLIADAQARRFVASLQIPDAELLTQVVVSSTGGLAYVLDIAGTVHLVDLTSRRVIGRVTTGVNEAMTMKLWADRQRLYLAGSHGYAVVDVTKRKLVHSFDFGSAGEFVTATRGIAFLPGQSAYAITDHFGLHLYNAETGAEIRYLRLDQIAGPVKGLTADIVVTPNGRTAYLALWDEEAILAFDTGTWQVTARVDTGRMPFSGATPRWLSLDPGRSSLYVVCEEGDRVVVVDTESCEVVGVVRLDE